MRPGAGEPAYTALPSPEFVSVTVRAGELVQAASVYHVQQPG
jgi:hypothetical protein